MLQLLAHLPSPELTWILETPLEVLDWGCATGEGTELLASLLQHSSVTGLDFARPAIDEASKRHKRAQFIWEESGKITGVFDVIITSNCLEHFESPLEVAAEHISHCRYLYLVLVPYREHPLHEQHFAQFRDESFPDAIGQFTRLDIVPFSVGNRFWPGQQVLAAYGSSAYRSARSQAVDGATIAALRSSLLEQCKTTVEISEMASQLRQQKCSATDLAIQIEHASLDMTKLREALEAKEAELAAKDAQVAVARSAARRQAKATAKALRAVERSSRQVGQLTERVAQYQAAEVRWTESSQAQENRTRELERQLSEVAAQLGQSTQLLQREEKTVLRPLLRAAWRHGRRIGRYLPAEVQDEIRASLAPAIKLLAPSSPQATFYQLARQKRRAKKGTELRSLEHSTQGQAPALGAKIPLEELREDQFWLTPHPHERHLTIIIFSVISWHFRFQRPQQLAKALAERGHKVYYVEPDFLEGSGEPYRLEETPFGNVKICKLACPLSPPRIYEELLSEEQLDAVRDALSLFARDHARGAVVRLVHHPFWTPVMRRWDTGLLVYDLIDEHSGFEGNGNWLLGQEADLLALADLVFVSSGVLLKKVDAKKAVLVRNAADIDYFGSIANKARSPQPVRIGYYGAIAGWFDSELVKFCAKAHPEWRFELIGSTFQAELLGLEQLPNVRFFGEKPYDELAKYVAEWDVAMIPFKRVALTEATNPVKVYEYLAAGKAIVATDLPELKVRPLADWVRTASGAEEFLRALETEVQSAGDVEAAEARRRIARDNSWNARAQDVEQAIYGQFPKVSVVMVCYGHLALTKAALRTMLAYSGYPNLEVVVVDNASPDGTGEWVRKITSSVEVVRVVLSESNFGFAGGVNRGVKASSGDYLIIVNNDIRVTPGWIFRFVRHLRRREGLGLVGPVTNAIGNEAAIPVGYADESEMIAAAERYTSMHCREIIKVEKLAFFAVALARSTWESVGELDEGYGLGYFEDDDYCERVKMSGRYLAVAEDVFVHHELSATFDELGERGKRAQFEAAKARFERRWGAWKAHQYRDQGVGGQGLVAGRTN